MEYSGTILPRVVVILFMFGAVQSLECKQCSNLEIDSGHGSIISKLGLDKFNSSPGCRRGSSYETIQCPDSDDQMTTYKCGYAEGSATFKLLLFLPVKVAVQTRGCVEADRFQRDGSVPKNGVVKKMIGVALSVLSESPTEVDGQICYCSTDLCNASPCDGIFIKETCIPKWALAVGGIAGLIIAGLLLSCCCCCCCACCRKKNPSYVFVQHPPAAGGITMVSNTAGIGMSSPADNGVRGMENPIYDKVT